MDVRYRLARYCWRHRPVLTAVVVASITVAVVSAVVPVLQASIVDDAIVTHRRSLWPLAAALGACALVTCLGLLVRRWAAGRLSLLVQHDLRTEMFGALVRLDGKPHDQLRTGQVIGRLTSDLSAVQTLLEELPATAGNLVLFLVSLGLMTMMSPTLTLVAVAVVPLMWLVTRATYRWIPAVSRQAQEQTGELAETISSAVLGVRVVKGFAQEPREQARVEAMARRLYGFRLRLVRLRGWLGGLIGTVSALGQVGVLALGGWLAVDGTITVGTFLAFSSYLALLMGPARTLASLLPTVQQTLPSMERIFQLLDTEPATVEAVDATPVSDGPLGIELDAVSFAHGNEPVLRDVSLTVPAGRTVALLGASGTGKSTLASLLTRVYDVGAGAVRIGGADVRTLTADSLRAAVGVVTQDCFLFQDTLRANLAHGRPDAGDEEIHEAARAAEIDAFIRSLPDGYDTVVGEGGLTLSGGQRQRIALARTLLSDPRILVLDDATSAVDAVTEAAIHDNLRRLLPGRTTLLIAHRSSSLALADEIAVLQHGRVVDVGTAEALAQRCPEYRRLVGIPEGEEQQEAWERSPQAPAGPVVRPAAVETVPDAGDGPSPETDMEWARAAAPGFRLPALLAPLRGQLVLGLSLVVAASAAIVALPLLVRDGIDAGITHRDSAAVTTASLIGLGVVLAGFVLTVAESLVTGRLGERLLFTLRAKSFAHLQRLGLDYYEREGSGAILTRMTVDIDTLSTFLQTDLASGLSSLLWLLGIGAVLLTVDLRLGLALLAVQPVLLAATLIYRKHSSRAYQRARERQSVLTRDLLEGIAGLRVIQALRGERAAVARFTRRGEEFVTARTAAQRQLAWYLAFVQLTADVSMILVLVLGARWVGDGTLTTGVLAAFLLYISLFLSPVQELTQFFDSYQQASVGLRRIGELLCTPASPAVDPDPVPLPERLAGGIVLDGTTFAYPTAGRAALSDVNLTIRPGQTVVLVGETGAGKSTLVKLLARFHDGTAGAVLIDGVDLRRVDPARYRARIGLVPQDSYLFPRTVWENIAYGRPDASAEEVVAAVRAVGADAAVAGLEGGYGHLVSSGGRNLSAGQRQLIALARAELVDPDILLLDEATAALDPATEAAVNRATARLTRARTTVIVAHRLSTAVTADLVVVLADGRVVEQGTHTDLVAADGYYTRLWRSYHRVPSAPLV